MKKLIYCFLYVLQICFLNETFSQNINTSLILESSILFSKQYAENESFGNKTKLFPFGIYFGLIVNATPKVEIEFRPGYSSGGDSFSGLEFNLIVKRRIINKYFSIGGRLNLHYNLGSHHGVLNEDYIVDDLFFNIGLGIDYELDPRLFFELYYLNNIENYYGYKRQFKYESNKWITYDTKLFHTIKFGMRYIF